MEIEYLSASRLTTYMDCSFKYFLQYHIKLPDLDKPTIHTEKGTAVHEVLEKFAKDDKDYTLNLKEYYSKSKLWELDSRKAGRGFPHPVEKNCGSCKWAIQGNRTICSIANQFIEDFPGCPKPNFEDDLKLAAAAINAKDTVFNRKIIGAEVPFEKEYDGFKVRGYIDLITELDDATIEVRDYKSGSRAKTTDEAFKDLQMRIYSMVAKDMYPQYSYVVMTLDFLRKGPVSVIFTKEDDNKTRDYLKEAYKKISEAKNPYRKKSFKCSWCIGYDVCGNIYDTFLNENGEFVLPPASKREDSRKRLPIAKEENNG